MPVAYALFDTALGLCALAWTEAGLAGVRLPELAAGHHAGFARRFPGAQEAEPSPLAAKAMAGIARLFEGEPVDLTDLPLDDAAQSDLSRRIYAATRAIPPGAVLTYGEVAARAGAPCEARAVGQAMGRNPWPVVVPCHRVMGAGGKLVGFSAPGGVETKLKLLALENARLSDAPGLFDDQGGLPIGVRPA